MTNRTTEKKSRGRIADYLPLIKAADGLTLGQVCSLSGLEPSTIQNWIKRGYVPHPVAKKYSERHLARILLIAELRECIPIERVGSLLSYINGDTDDVSDDIITEEALYDLYRGMTEQLDGSKLSAQMVSKTALKAADSLEDIDEEKRIRIRSALLIMANVYASALFKQEADRIFGSCIED